MINFLLNLGCSVFGGLSIQNEMACFPNLWGIMLYCFVTSNMAMSVLGSIFFLVWNLKNLCCPWYNFFTLFRKGCSKMSISLLSLLVGYDGPATMGLNLRSLGLGISEYSDFCVPTGVFYLFGFVNLLVVRRSCWFWRYGLLRSLFSFLVCDLFCILQNLVIFDIILLSMFVSISLK